MSPKNGLGVTLSPKSDMYITSITSIILIIVLNPCTDE